MLNLPFLATCQRFQRIRERINFPLRNQVSIALNCCKFNSFTLINIMFKSKKLYEVEPICLIEEEMSIFCLYFAKISTFLLFLKQCCDVN